MTSLRKQMGPDREGFGKDPFGYSSLAWHKWGVAQTLAGFPIDITKAPTSEDLKSPVLWLSQAHAMQEAARIVIQNNPNLGLLPESMRGACDCQYCAVGLMLVGYSLEICLKAMIIMTKGVAEYTAQERNFKHHRLEELANFIPGLDAKELAILKTLTHFVMWAGRYPDPGSGREQATEDIFSTAEAHQISAKDLFTLAARIMGYSRFVADRL